MEDSFFRVLNEDEVKEFRSWARNNTGELLESELSGRIEVFHPVVRDEWKKIKAECLPKD